MHSILKDKRIVDKVLTKVVMGYDLDQEFSGHHLFPDVQVTEMGGKIVKFGICGNQYQTFTRGNRAWYWYLLFK